MEAPLNTHQSSLHYINASPCPIHINDDHAHLNLNLAVAHVSNPSFRSFPALEQISTLKTSAKLGATILELTRRHRVVRKFRFADGWAAL